MAHAYIVERREVPASLSGTFRTPDSHGRASILKALQLGGKGHRRHRSNLLRLLLSLLLVLLLLLLLLLPPPPPPPLLPRR